MNQSNLNPKEAITTCINATHIAPIITVGFVLTLLISCIYTPKFAMSFLDPVLKWSIGNVPETWLLYVLALGIILLTGFMPWLFTTFCTIFVFGGAFGICIGSYNSSSIWQTWFVIFLILLAAILAGHESKIITPYFKEFSLVADDPCDEDCRKFLSGIKQVSFALLNCFLFIFAPLSLIAAILSI